MATRVLHGMDFFLQTLGQTITQRKFLQYFDDVDSLKLKILKGRRHKELKRPIFLLHTLAVERAKALYSIVNE
jgi:hypothetical protein